MKGIVFDLLEQVVTSELGEDKWDALLDATGLAGAYTAVGTYPHEELLALVDAASEVTGTPPDDLVRWFGREALPLLYTRYPSFFDPHTGTRSFLLTLNDVIHPEVRKLFPGAYAPSFVVDSSNDDVVELGYESHRGLCTFAEGLIEGSATHYGETVSIEQPQCAKRGDPTCILRTTISAG
jgi:hypothetical protein